MKNVIKMKQVIFFLLISFSAFSQQKDTSLNGYSDIFKLYSKKYSPLIVQYPGGFWGQKWTHYRIIYKNKGHWFLADHFSSPTKLFTDSINVKKCDNCYSIFKELQVKGKDLKSEKDITSQCIKRTLVINSKGDSVIQEDNLLLWTDVDVQILEYYIAKKIRKIFQRSPSTAQEICPNDQDRKLFRDFVNAIKNAH